MNVKTPPDKRGGYIKLRCRCMRGSMVLVHPALHALQVCHHQAAPMQPPGPRGIQCHSSMHGDVRRRRDRKHREGGSDWADGKCPERVRLGEMISQAMLQPNCTQEASAAPKWLEAGRGSFVLGSLDAPGGPHQQIKG